LQGGGALGAYQAGVYEALSEAGVSARLGGGDLNRRINAALIAGNPPETRVDRLRAFWEGVTSHPWSLAAMLWDACWDVAIWHASLLTRQAAAFALAAAPGLLWPHVPHHPGSRPRALRRPRAWYDTAPLRAKLEELVDFDRVNAGDMRLSVGAVNVRTGNFTYFDTMTHTIRAGARDEQRRPFHLAFPRLEIDGEHYWDGGMVSNTPLQWVLESEPQRDTLAFQVDLWRAHAATFHGALLKLRRARKRFSTRAVPAPTQTASGENSG